MKPATNTPTEVLSQAMFAAAPHPDLPNAAAFAPLVGSWDLVVTDVEPDGTTSTRDGEWHFGWALGGRALVDVWISPSRATRARTGQDGGEWGTSIRYPDPATGLWRSTWHGPARGWLIPFTVTTDDDGAPMLAGERDGVALRWIFSEVTAESFRWRAEETPPGAAPSVRQRFAATRRPAG